MRFFKVFKTTEVEPLMKIIGILGRSLSDEKDLDLLKRTIVVDCSPEIAKQLFDLTNVFISLTHVQGENHRTLLLKQGYSWDNTHTGFTIYGEIIKDELRELK